MQQEYDKMQMLRKSVRKQKRMNLYILLLTIICIVSVSYAATIIFRGSARSGIHANTILVKANATFTAQSASSALSFTKTGERFDWTAKIENECDSLLHYYYTIKTSADQELAKAVLVYYNDQFIGTLEEISTKNIYLQSPVSVVGVEKTSEDHLVFELHQAATDSFYDQKTVAVQISAFTENVDDIEAIYVTTEKEFHRAVDDVNSGLLLNAVRSEDEITIEEGALQKVPKIVLMSDIALSTEKIELSAPCAVELNGHILSGAMTLNGQNALLDVRNNGNDNGMEATVTLKEYQQTKAEQLVKERVMSRVGTGLAAGKSLRLLGTLSFYGNQITVPAGSHYTYESDTITAGEITETAIDLAKVHFPSQEVVSIPLKILGTADTLATTYLSHMPSEDEVVSTSLFLPTALKEKNASIIWTSSRPEIMDHTGKIVATNADSEKVELYAEIRVNETVKTLKYAFRVTAKSNEVNFYKLVAEISPMTIYYVYDEMDALYTTYYFPVVGGSYSYLSDYSTPGEKQEYENNPSYRWYAYQDIGLTSLEYFLTEEQKATYDYIEIDKSGSNYAVVLKQFTPNNYARVTVRGTFATGESFESIVNIIIATGKNTELMEIAYNSVQEELSRVDVLYQMLTTRKAEGMEKENGDFTLPSSYEGYEISYTKATDAISKITLQGARYTICVDPTKFSSAEMRVPFNCTIRHGAVENTRTLYITVPAAIHTSDLGNATLFNATKYQVWNQLPQEEKGGESGFQITENTIVNLTPDYILLRDIVGDEVYHNEYHTLKLDYEAKYSKEHGGCKNLAFQIPDKGNVVSVTDTRAYDLAALIQWATGKEKMTAQSVVNHTEYLDGKGNTLSDGQEYLNTDEVAVIKAYYQKASGKTNTFDSLWSGITETPNGFLIFDSARINQMLSYMIQTARLNNTDAAESYFKYVETLQWADNEKDFGVEATGVAGYAPNKELIGGNNWGSSMYYTNPIYKEDNTEYLSEGEKEVLKVLLVNAARRGNYSYELETHIRNEFDASLVKPTFFTAEGIGSLVNAFYGDAGIQVGLAEGYASCKLNGNPAIYNMDGLGAALNYFIVLESLDIKGNREQYGFLSESLLSQFFQRMTNTNAQIKTLVMEYCAGNYVVFDLEATKNLAKLTSMDYSHNPGITQVSVLVNTNRSQYTYVNISDIGANQGQNYFSGKEYDFTEYAVQNLAASGCTVVYGNGEQISSSEKVSDALTFLNEFQQIIAENMFAVNQVVDAQGNETDIIWRIEEGNNIDPEVISVAGTVATIDTIQEMNRNISPYYYCQQSFSFDGKTYEAGHIYEYNSDEKGTILVTDLGSHEVVMAKKREIPVKTENDFDLDNIVLPEPELMEETTEKILVDTKPQIVSQKSVSPAYGGEITVGRDYTLLFRCNTFRNDLDYGRFFMWDSDGKLGGVAQDNIADNKYIYFALLTQAQAECLEYLKEDHSMEEIVARVEITENVELSRDGNGAYSILFGANSFNDDSQYYIYNPVTARYVNRLMNSWYTQITLSELLSEAGLYSVRSNILINNNFAAEYNSDRVVSVAISNATNWIVTPYEVELSGGGKHEPGTSQYVPFLTLTYRDDREPSAIMDVPNIKYEIVKKENTYEETTTKGYREQSVFLGTQNFLTQDENMAYRYQYLYTHDAVTNKKTDIYEKTVYELEVSYTTKDDITSQIDWEKVEKAIYTYYTTNEEASQVRLEIYRDGFQFIWGTEIDTIPADDADYVLKEEGGWIGDSLEEDNPSGPGNFSWRIEREGGPYLSYVQQISDQTELVQKKNLIANVADPNIDIAYRYVGNTGTESVYRGGELPIAMSYINRQGYSYALSQEGLIWKPVAMEEDTGAGRSMDAVLAEANQHFGDAQYGMYYGKYYAYNGPEKVTLSNVRYQTNWVYRILPNSNNSAFTFVPVKPYIDCNDIDIPLLEIVNGTLGEAQRGSLYNLQIGADRKQNWETRTYYNGFHIFTYNEQAGSYYLKTFCDVDYRTTNAQNLIRWNNTRINGNSNQVNYHGEGYYGGTGGNIPTVISAVVHEPNGDGTYTDYVRYFKVNVVG